MQRSKETDTQLLGSSNKILNLAVEFMRDSHLNYALGAATGDF